MTCNHPNSEFDKFGGPFPFLERVKLDTSNLECMLIVVSITATDHKQPQKERGQGSHHDKIPLITVLHCNIRL